MMRTALFAAAVVVLAAQTTPTRAADPDISGNWLLSYVPRASSASNFALLKVEMKDGKPVVSVLAPQGKGFNLEVTGFEIKDGKSLKFKTSVGASFEGTIGADGKVLGNFGDDRQMFRAMLTKTDKTEIAEQSSRIDAPAGPAADLQKLQAEPAKLRAAAAKEDDADKKKELLDKATEATKLVTEKMPDLLRATIAKQGDTPFAIDAVGDLIAGAVKYKVTAEEAATFIPTIEKAAAPFGARYSRAAIIQTVETMATAKSLDAAVAVTAAEKLSKSLTPETPATYESRVLTAYKTALERSEIKDKDATLKTVTASLAKLEEKIDAEYRKTVPPFKPTAFAGRKDKAANQVVVMELFTGAQCPPCVSADVAFDALLKSYKPGELVLIQYHLHIPGPDPLTNTEAIARAKFYGVNSTPTAMLNGGKSPALGGGMANAEARFKTLINVIDPMLEKSADVKLAGKASRTGDKIDIGVEVTGGDGDDMKLRLLVVEEDVKYVGGNGLRFHHQVVRAMPGGADGVAVKDKTFKHTASVDLVEVRKDLTKYLDEFAANRPFPKPERPMEMKALRVIALVQNDKTKEIVQAIQLDVEAKPATGTGGGR